ncbi:hypothetical protein [Nocardia salmonicida]|uniref:hypothetical protein n=1 Tax=Nocardia salmonicida TaxID=53431 RepID=UPI002E2CCA35|nr:hypothetical protein [Nocardia salmonicida]
METERNPALNDFHRGRWRADRRDREVGEDGGMSGVKFVRRVDGLTYEFVREGDAYGFPSYRRVDLWCRRLPDFGWVVCNAADEVSSRPFDEPGQGEFPPEGVWVSRKGAQSYVYDLVRADPRAATGSGIR